MSNENSASDVILVLPFTPSTYLHPAPLLPLIASALPSASRSFTVLLHTPSAPPRRRSSALTLSYEPPTIDPTKQLYTKLRRNPKANWDGLHAFLGKLYGVLVGAAFKEGKVLLRTEVVFENEDGSVLYELLSNKPGTHVVQVEERQLPPNTPSSTLPAPSFAHSTWTPPPPSQGFPVVALGGTFDHLHGAHRLLLQLAAFLCTRKLIVGVTSASLLTHKANAGLVESLEKRKAGVEEFLFRVGVSRPGQGTPAMDVVEISDLYGPTAHDADIQALVVSRETVSGGGEIAKVRKEKDLPALEVFVIDVLGSQLEEATGDLREVTDEKALKEAKMGSTGIRQWIADHPNDA